ncbi:YpbS family protein [Sutcliffiella horikoshii]|uniref:YpbS family protein n=1 Tax=Sutcliffiella horikoshii TaxID=79883 RepID=UPI0007D0426B|nr:YpbS family protein [Sutcliffiella horikoshii]MCM3617297.1 YpbS family protein [Sutcliffiella horikoshii]
MSVHKAISEHSRKQNKVVMSFLQLEQQREAYIEEATQLCREKEPFTTEKINAVTKQINELARKGIAPQRKLVTKEMVEEFVSRSN